MSAERIRRSRSTSRADPAPRAESSPPADSSTGGDPSASPPHDETEGRDGSGAARLDALLEIGRNHVLESNRVSERFFARNAEAVARTCRAMATRFHRGGRLLVVADGRSRSDALHVSVEFVHPVLVGKRALPAMVVEREPAAWISALGRPDDMVLGIHPGGRPERRDPDGGTDRVVSGIVAGRAAGLITVALAGAEVPDGVADAHHLLSVPSRNPAVVQEVQETAYHVLWELVHVFFEHGRGP